MNIYKKAMCPHCGRHLAKSKLQNKGYSYECEHCDEDFYSVEVIYQDELGGKQ